MNGGKTRIRGEVLAGVAGLGVLIAYLILQDPRVLILKEVQCVEHSVIINDGCTAPNHGFAISKNPAERTGGRRIVGEGKARLEIMPIRMEEPRGMVGLAPQRISDEGIQQAATRSGTTCKARLAVGDAWTDYLVKTEVGNGFEAIHFVRDRIILIAQAIGERQIAGGLPGILGISFGFIIAIGAVVACPLWQRLELPVVVVVALDRSEIAENKSKSAVVQALRDGVGCKVGRSQLRAAAGQAAHASAQAPGHIVKVTFQVIAGLNGLECPSH